MKAIKIKIGFLFYTFLASILLNSSFVSADKIQEEREEEREEDWRSIETKNRKNEDIKKNVESYTIKENKDIKSSSSKYEGTDSLDDGLLDPISPDPSCAINKEDLSIYANDIDSSCWNPPESTVEEEEIEMFVQVSDLYGGDDPSDACDDEGDSSISNEEDSSTCDINDNRKDEEKGTFVKKKVDKHWGHDENILRMRDTLRDMGTKKDPNTKRPPIFLIPGLASTRLVAWKTKSCRHKLLSDVKVQEYMWLHVGKLVEMATIDSSCWEECMSLGLNQTDMDVEGIGCKLRPDEGIDAISSLAPNSASSNLLVGGTNTVYAWLVQWLADNLGYDVTSIIGLPYDWRLSPDKMEQRDGFLTLTRRRIEAAVSSSGSPGIVVAHSMGNMILRYFLEWLRHELRLEAFIRYKKAAARRMNANNKNTGWMAGTKESSDNIYDFSDTEIQQEGNDIGGKVKDMAAILKTSFDDILKSFLYDYNNKNNGAKKMKGIEQLDQDKILELENRFSHKEKSLWELASIEGDTAWLEWIDKHIWTYVGLSAPLLGAGNTLRSVISGEKMGMPIPEASARRVELSFGSTHTINVISTKMGFCDNDSISNSTHDQINRAGKSAIPEDGNRQNLACLEDVVDQIQRYSKTSDPWKNFPVLRSLLVDRVDWDTDFPLIKIQKEKCHKGEKPPCAARNSTNLSALDVQNGHIFDVFSEVWNEEGDPMKVKKEQLKQSWWNSAFPNIMASTWDRPHIKNVIMAYGVDSPTEVGYVYRKEERINDNHDETIKDPKSKETSEIKYDGIPNLYSAIWENEYGEHTVENFGASRSLTDAVLMKKPKKVPLNNGNTTGSLFHSGDGSVSYLSLSWAHTWLLHATRAMRHSFPDTYEAYRGSTGDDTITGKNPLESIKVTHRPRGGSEWRKGVPESWKNRKEGKDGESTSKDGDTGTTHPHGTKYKPEMVRFQSEGTSRSTGNRYTTSIIEAVGVEHKETTRNYDILAAAFTDVLNYMHDDFGLL